MINLRMFSTVTIRIEGSDKSEDVLYCYNQDRREGRNLRMFCTVTIKIEGRDKSEDVQYHYNQDRKEG